MTVRQSIRDWLRNNPRTTPAEISAGIGIGIITVRGALRRMLGNGGAIRHLTARVMPHSSGIKYANEWSLAPKEIIVLDADGFPVPRALPGGTIVLFKKGWKPGSTIGTRVLCAA